MDSFEIDMELLRLLGEVQRSVGELDAEDGRQSFLKALSAVHGRAEKVSEIAARLVRLIETLGSEQPPESLTPTGRFAVSVLATLDCLEGFLTSTGDAAAQELIHQAASTVLVAVGRDPAEWDASTVESPAAEVAPPSEPAAEVGAGKSPDFGALPDLDDLAAQLVEADEEDRESLTPLLDACRELANSSGLPDDLQDALSDAVSGLEQAMSGKRRSSKKTESARVALAQIGFALEELMNLHEVWEMSVGAATAAEPAAARADEASPDEPEEIPPVEVEPTRDEDPIEASQAATPEPQSTGGASATSFPVPEDADPDLLEDFITEGFDYLEQAEQALLVLEGDPDDKEAVNVVFRAFHTVKGVSGFLELDAITDLAHHAESLLSRVRDGDLLFSPSVADLTLRSADALRDLLEGIRAATGDGGEVALPAGYAKLIAILSDQDHVERLAGGERLSLDEIGGQTDAAAEGGASAANEGSVRLKTARLDRLLDLVGELVVAHAMVAEDQIVQGPHHGLLARKVNRSEKILRELQDVTTSMRMIPLKQAFRKISRVVRDVGRRAGKPVVLVTNGEDTELDRNMVNVITDPLVHMVRNSIDHGIESPSDRAAAGKPEAGEIRLSANQVGGSVVIEIEDDGQGLDRDKIVAKAVASGLIESDRGMSDSDIFALIFAPGFSTADAVTDISGRGVGMDVVRRSVESLRGRIDIESHPGKGSRFSIRLPLTLAITEGMLLRVGSERYIIPVVKIQMSFRPEPGEIHTVAGRGEMVTLHDRLLPITRMHQVYDISDACEDLSEGLLIIVGEGSRSSALLVDEILGQQQFVVKALPGKIAEAPGVAGGAIMGDGEVGLILDPDELIALTRTEGASVGHRSVA